MSRVEGPRDGQQRIAELERQLGQLQDAVFRKSATVKTHGDDITSILNPGAWQSVTLQNSFTAVSTLGYYIDALGRVFFKGSIGVPPGDDGLRPKTIFTLASGFGPPEAIPFVCHGEFADSVAESIITVQTNGNVQLTLAGYGGQVIPLGIIQFRTS